MHLPFTGPAAAISATATSDGVISGAWVASIVVVTNKSKKTT
jgi:hypothetical protein